MNNTKIDWCTMSWNPVTGCLHGCEYCYARGIANRFGGALSALSGENVNLDTRPNTADCWKQPTAIDEPRGYKTKSGKVISAPFPYGFLPTFHRYRLDEPAKKKKPQTIFVGSMCDLFGEWVPDEWIKAVFDACAAAPWHRYLFLTKNPDRYMKLAMAGLLPISENMWYGSTITNPDDEYFYDKISGGERKRFLSIEPILAPFEKKGQALTDWVIIGAETGNRKGKVIPKREWIENIAAQCRENNIPIFMKESLRGLMGSDFVQEFGWERRCQNGMQA